MTYAAEMGSGAMIYIPALIKISADIQKLIRTESQTHIQHGDVISLLLFLQNKGSRPISRNLHTGNREGDRMDTLRRILGF
jgi:hypothetical protein